MAQRKMVPRKTHKFQLRQDHAEDIHIQEIVEYWKTQKKGVTNIRKAIALFYALEQGDDSLLSEMFPHRAGQAQPMFPDAPTIVEALNRLTSTMERIQVPVMVEREPEKPKLAGLKAMRQLQAPSYDDDAPMLTTSKNTSVNASQNLVSLALGMVDDDDAPTIVMKKSDGMSATENFLKGMSGL